MGTLREEIEALRYRCAGDDNEEAQSAAFIPLQSLYELLSEEKIKQAVENVGQIEFFHKDQVVRWIVANGRRIFAILATLEDKEHLIMKFVRREFQGTGFDNKLPFSREFLEKIVPDIADQFYEKQWEYVSPILSKNVIHRVLPEETRLPFTYNKKIDSGGFGEIYEISLHSRHQKERLLPEDGNQRMVRKEFKSALFTPNSDPDAMADSFSENDYTKELRNLSILNELRHPNIIELITSYTYRKKHNLIFPLIEGGNLGTFFRTDRPAEFRKNETFLIAISELSSAIEKVHLYTHERFNVKLMGCHYDLKPKNILVRGSTFVLADFGLSKLKHTSECPQDIYEGGASDYFAPECEDSNKGFERNAINQSSDVWSFGCILAEILTYMHLGPDGIIKFKKKRRVKIGSAQMAAFHQGLGQVNQGFRDWLSQMPTNSDTFTRNLVKLIRQMTDLDPEARPNAERVRLDLQKISVQTHYLSVKGLYETLVKKMEDSFEAYSEYMRIKSWGSVLGFTQGDGVDIEACGLTEKMELVSMYTCLGNIQNELEFTIEQCQNALSPIFNSLRCLGDELFHLLPQELDIKARDQWETEMVRSENLEDLRKTAQASDNSRIATLARIKRMSILAAERGVARLSPDNVNLKIPYKRIKPTAPFESHTYAELREGDTPTKNVLIEWIKYGNHETAFYKELLARIESLAALLHSSTNVPDFRILHCSGFVSHDAEGAYGLLFDLPDRSISVPKSLAEVIKQTHTFRDRPSLESRFNLALSLALSLSGVHKVGWLHKSISAHNVLLSIPSAEAKTTNASQWLANPYLIGFNHSRQDDVLAFTLGPNDNGKALQYYHPEYEKKTVPQIPYRLHYDYYSLGLVLLEIGLWERLPTLGLIQGRKATSNSEMLEHLLKNRVVKLGHHMGVNYQDAVLACLKAFQGPQNTKSPPEDNTVLQLKFEEQVVQRLRRCHA